VAGSSADLLAQLNEQPPGRALLPVLALAWLAIVGLVVTAGTWPAWRAARRPPAQVLRRGDAPRRVRSGMPASLLVLGARLAAAARARYAAAVAVLAVCIGVLTLMLALATLLERLRDDPATIGKRYELTVRLDPILEPDVAAIPGVADVAPRYQVEVADSFRLGEPLRLVAFPGDHTAFEAPPLAEGRRVRGPGEAEVGIGLADALGLRPGATLAVQLEGAAEVRFRVVGVVRALERDGRIAYVQPDRLLDADPALGGGSLAVKLDPGAERAAVEDDLAALGAPPQRVAAATTRNAAFLGVLAAVLRGVGLAIGLVCLYALVQALAMTARERRGAVALLRAAGGDARTVGLLLAGAALALALPATVAGLLLEWLLLGPLVAGLAAGYAALPLAPSAGHVAIVAGAVLLLATVATWLVARRAAREPIVRGLREE
jgi:ABC-type lipoprotein release transport system permease subunit